MRTVTIERDAKGSLGMQITEGSDGKVYVQSVISGGPAYQSSKIFGGDQIIAVDGHNLLSKKYEDALNCLKSTGNKVQFVVSHLSTSTSNIHSQSTMRISEFENLKGRINLSNIDETHLDKVNLKSTVSKLQRTVESTNENQKNSCATSPLEKYLTESCHDSSNIHKYRISTDKSGLNTPTEVPYHKHIRYEIEAENDSLMSKKTIPSPPEIQPNLNRNVSKSCTLIYDKKTPIIVDIDLNDGDYNSQSLDRKKLKNSEELPNNNKDNSMSESKQKIAIPPIALPRSLGLSRKWRGPVKYPVTPVKKTLGLSDNDSSYLTTSDEEQVFI